MSAHDPAAIFIGDELTAAGYRLAGVRVLTPSLEQATESLERARIQAELVLITAEYAARVPQRLLEASHGALVAIVPDALEHQKLTDGAERLRRELGLGE